MLPLFWLGRGRGQAWSKIRGLGPRGPRFESGRPHHFVLIIVAAYSGLPGGGNCGSYVCFFARRWVVGGGFLNGWLMIAVFVLLEYSF